MFFPSAHEPGANVSKSLLNSPVRKMARPHRAKPLTSNDQALIIRNMSLNDLKLMFTWAKAEGWNPGKYDDIPYYSIDPKGFYVLEVNGEAAAVIAAVRYSSEFAFVGFYIVNPQFRGNGYGLQLWNYALTQLGTISNIGLYAVAAQVKNYQKSGFESAFFNWRWQGYSSKKIKNYKHAPELREARDEDAEKIAELDAAFFPARRTNFIKRMLGLKKALEFKSEKDKCSAILACNNTDKIIGFGVIRPCVNGYRIGPLYAFDYKTAKHISYELMRHIDEHSQVMMDSPSANAETEKLAQKLGFTHLPEADTVAMFTKEATQITQQGNFAIASLDLG